MLKVISESELKRKFENWDTEKVLSNPILFNQVLWYMGLDTRHAVETQEGLTHRNKYDEVVNCIRWVGVERTDRDWLNNPHSSLGAHYFSADFQTKKEMRTLMGPDASAYVVQDREELSYTMKKLGEMDKCKE